MSWTPSKSRSYMSGDVCTVDLWKAGHPAAFAPSLASSTCIVCHSAMSTDLLDDGPKVPVDVALTLCNIVTVLHVSHLEVVHEGWDDDVLVAV